MKENHARNENFYQLLDDSSQKNYDFENIGDKISSTSKIMQLEYEKGQLQMQINQLWDNLAESKEKQRALEVELENRNEVVNSLIYSIEQNKQNFKKLHEHQNNLVKFVNNIDENRSAIVARFNGMKSKCEETISNLNQKLSELQKTENNRDIDVMQLKEHIRQQEENLCEARKAHCRDQQLLRETDKKLEKALQAEEKAKAENVAFLKQVKEKEGQWATEKQQLMSAMENLRDKFSADMNEEKNLTNTIEEMRRQERIQFQKTLRMQMEKHMQLEAHIRSLEVQVHKKQLAEQNENMNPNSIRTTISQRNKRPCSVSQKSDVVESDFSSSIAESLFKKRRLEVSSAHTPRATNANNRCFYRSPAVDSTSILTDRDDEIPNQTL